MAEVVVPLAAAFVLGFGASRAGLPPLVGYLAAGFGLSALGVEGGQAVDVVADLGVLLLLFGIGLKLTPATLARPVVWAGTTVHLAIWMVVTVPLLLGLGALGLPIVEGLGVGRTVVLAFALGFSSTVFAVKTLEATSEGGSLAGRLALGSLVMQDVLAVGFLAAVGGVPSAWAVPVVAGVVLLRPVWGWLLDRAGYAELLPLLGLVLALGVGAATFDAVGIKPDLGALLVGMLLANHPKAADLATGLLSLKDLLLVGFFLSIGLGRPPGAETVVVVAALLLLLPLKSLAHLAVLRRFRLRARTTWHTTVTLANYSEFGLIVAVVGAEQGVLPDTVAPVLAVLVAASFVVAAPVNRYRYDVYARLHEYLVARQREPLDPEDQLIDPGDATVLVFGMGGVGEGAYDELVVAQHGRVVGVDHSQSVVERQTAAGRRAVRGDALDSDFWDRMTLHPHVELAVLAMSDHAANVQAVRRIREFLPEVAIAAIASHADEVDELRRLGVTVARNLYEEAGQGLADDACAVVPGLRPTGASGAG